MAHLKRFYVNDLSNEPFHGGHKVILDAGQSNHLKNTLRLKPGTVIEIFTNHNESYTAEVSSIPPKGGVEAKILSKVISKTVSGPDITLACAIAKGNRMDWLIEKTAEIGLTRLIPLITRRTVAKPTDQAKKIERWHKLAIAAATQTGQSSMLDITPPVEFDSLGGLVKDYSLTLIAVPNADKYLPEVLEKSNLADKILYLIGPEGDFTADETNMAVKWGIQPVRLPINAILRVETAAITMLAMLQYQYYKSYAPVEKT